MDEEAGGAGEVVSEFEVEGKGEGVDVDVVMARVWAVPDVDTFEDEEGTANGFWKEKAEEGAGMSTWAELECKRSGTKTGKVQLDKRGTVWGY